LLNLSLKLNKREFEYDIYSLIRAFYPGSTIRIWYEGDELPDSDYSYQYQVIYEESSITFLVFERDQEISRTITRISAQADRRERKNYVKKLVYKALAKITKRELPWGDLTGIRPSKIVMGMLEDGKTNVEAATLMRDTYGISPDKIALAITVANKERELLNKFNYKDGYSLYVGIPFCPSICLYCSFGSHPMSQWNYMVESYLDALCKELKFIASKMKGRSCDTIYIGGGTPTTLSPDQLERLLRFIQSIFPMKGVKEFTVEAGRPDTITREKLMILKRYPVTRISINPQTMNQETLDLIGRRHTVEDIISKYNLAREMGFDNINMDLIVGLPGEHKEQVSRTLKQIKAMNPDSLTIHSLALKRAARLNLFKDMYDEISFENSQEIMQMTADCAYGMDMDPYYLYRQKDIAGNFENVGYAKLDKEGIYNILIMEEKQTIMAAGAGASTKFVFQGGRRTLRAENVKDLKNYVERIDEMLKRKEAGIKEISTQ